MFNLNKRQLSLLSLLVIVGISSIPFTPSNLIFIPLFITFIGSLAFGALVRETHKIQ